MNTTQLDLIYLPEIIELLEMEKNSDLVGTFNRYLIARLIKVRQGGFDSGTLEQIKMFLSSIKVIYTQKQENVDLTAQNMPGMFDYGSWLEAYALIHHNSTKKAARYIAIFLSKLETTEEQSQYVIGLSNSKYMRKAFKEEPFLADFKKNNIDLYKNSVGLKLMNNL